MKLLALPILTLVCATALAVGQPTAIEAITKPSGDVTLSFVLPGKIERIEVKEGQAVKAGDLLVQQDDSVDKVKVALLKAQSENTTEIKAAEKQRDQARVDLKRFEESHKAGGVTDLELDRARLEVDINELRVELAKFKFEQSKLAYDEERLKLPRMQLLSPINGQVEKLISKQGEAVESLGPVVRVVNIDPLHIDVPVPRGIAAGLKPDSPAETSFSDPQAQPVAGKVIHVAQVADSASDTLMVRVEVPNSQGRAAGERVRVSFPRQLAPAVPAAEVGEKSDATEKGLFHGDQPAVR